MLGSTDCALGGRAQKVAAPHMAQSREKHSLRFWFRGFFHQSLSGESYESCVYFFFLTAGPCGVNGFGHLDQGFAVVREKKRTLIRCCGGGRMHWEVGPWLPMQ